MSTDKGEITREQVDKAIEAAHACDARRVNAALGAFWYERDPTKEGYSMAVRDMRAAVRGLATKQAAAAQRD